MALPLIGAALGIGGEVAGGLIARSGQEATNRAQMELAQKQMDFQERMSSTAWQRATTDMKAAGINPMLAYMQGGASSPQGQMATLQNPNVALGSNVASSVGSALSVVNAIKDARLRDAQVKATRSQGEKAQAEADVTRAELLEPEDYQDAGGPTMPRTYFGRYRQAMIDNLQANARRTAAEARISDRDAQQETSWLGRSLNWVRRFRESFMGGSNPASAAGTLMGGKYPVIP